VALALHPSRDHGKGTRAPSSHYQSALKTPYWPNVVGVVLIVVVLVAIVEVLVPGVVRVVLSRGPVVVLHEPSNTDIYSDVLATTRNLEVAHLNFL